MLEIYNITKTSANQSAYLSQVPGTQLYLHWISDDSDLGALFDCLGGFTHAMVDPSLVLLGQYFFKDMLDNRWICLIKGTYLLELDDGGLSIERHQELPQDKALGEQSTKWSPCGESIGADCQASRKSTPFVKT